MNPSAFIPAGLALLGAAPLAITAEHALAIGVLRYPLQTLRA
jgi:hypothetical protein